MDVQKYLKESKLLGDKLIKSKISIIGRHVPWLPLPSHANGGYAVNIDKSTSAKRLRPECRSECGEAKIAPMRKLTIGIFVSREVVGIPSVMGLGGAVGHDGVLIESKLFDRRLVCLNSALAAT